MEEMLRALNDFFVWFGMDLTPQSLLKCAILTVLVFGLLLVIAVLYRGEMQNRDIIGVLREFGGDGAIQGDELVFARRTLDIRTETTAAHVAIFVVFQVRVGESVAYRRRKAYSASMRLRMRAKITNNLGEGDFGFFPERHTRIAKKIADLAADEVQRARRLATPFWEQVPLIKHLVKLPVKPYDVGVGETAIRLTFPINPVYLLTAHPDREVKTSAWLTLLTSFFALVMQIFFGGNIDATHPQPRERSQQSIAAAPRTN